MGINTTFLRRCIDALESVHGGNFAAITLDLLPAFIDDAKALADRLEQENDG